MLRDTRGFTLIELLIVVVIIGILAAIAIPQFASTKEKAFDATAKSDLRNAMTAQEAYFADSLKYGSTAQALAAGLFSPSPSVTTATAGSAGGYVASAIHSGSGQEFYVVVGSGAATDGKIQAK